MMQTQQAAGWWRRKPELSSGFRGGPPRAVSIERREGLMSFLALMLFTFVLLLAPQHVFPVLAPLRIALLSIALALAFHIGTRMKAGRELVRMDTATTLALLLLGWATITVPFSLWPGGSVTFLAAVFIKSLIVFVLLANVIDSTWKLRWLSWGLMGMAVPLALTTMRNFASGVYVEGGNRAMGYDSPLAANPNDMALLLNMFLPLAIACFLCSRRLAARVVTGSIVVLMIGAVIATFSRTGFLTLIVIALMYLFVLGRRHARMLAPVLLILLFISVPFLPEEYMGRLATITDVQTDTTGSAQVRLEDMKVAFRLAFTNPVFGTGVGVNVLAMNEARGPTWIEIHNVYLALAVELGVLGLVLFLLLMGTCIKSARRVVRETAGRPEYEELNTLATAILVSLLAFAFAALFHPVAYHFYFYYMAGLALALKGIWRAEQGSVLETDREPT